MSDTQQFSHPPADGVLRLFTAISLPSEIQEKVSDLVTRLQKGAAFTGSHPAWVAPENTHITMVFLGSQPAKRLESLKRCCDEAAASCEPFELKLGGLTLFPSPKEPKVICLGISGEIRKLEIVRERLASGLHRQGFESDSRPFRPHITLARIKSMRGVAGLRDLLGSHRKIHPGPFEAIALTLYRSELNAAGAEYEKLHESPFAAAADSES